MCDSCIKIDDLIERCQNLQRSIDDEATVEGVGEMIADLEALKAALHPEREGGAEPAEEGRRVIEASAGDLRAIVKKLRRHLN